MPLTNAEAAHLLRRAAMGGTNRQVREFVGLSRSAAVDKVMDTSVTSPTPRFRGFGNVGDWQVQTRMIDWWVDRMIEEPPTIEEKLVLFWHSHFATEREKVQDAELIWNQQKIFRRHGRGSFRVLLEKVSLDPAMIIYLDNETNFAGAEQENFARELMELHTIGNGRFTEADVIAMARAWTGHTVVGWDGSGYDPTYVFRRDKHDFGNKTLFGTTKNWDAVDTLDELCLGSKRNDLSDFIARKMFQFYVHTNPSQAVVDDLAAGFRSSGLNITHLLRSILMHDEFWAQHSRYALVKSPVEFMVDVMRRCRMTSEDTSVRWRMSNMGMTLFDPPDVAGWRQNDAWLGTGNAWAKSSWINSLKWKAKENRVLQGLEDHTPTEVIDNVVIFLGLFEVSSQSRRHAQDLIQTVQNDYPWAMKYEPFAVGLFMPEVQCA